MKKWLTACFILLIAGSAKAQVVINLQLIPQGLTTKDQLWNLSLVNSEGQQSYVHVEMQMSDALTNERVLTAVTREFILPPGVKQLRAMDVGPVVYNAINPSYSIDAAPNGLLPVGVFNVCYSVVKMKGERLGDECDNITIEPVSPPTLVMPYDRDTIEVSRPQFNWTPPAPMNLFNRLTYDLSLVEVLPTQQPADAIMQNMPVLLLRDVNMASSAYPSTLKELDTAKTYAWRIKAKNNGLTVANSETWTFRVASSSSGDCSQQKQFQYAKLSAQPEASFINASGPLHIVFDNDYNASSVSVAVTDITKSKRIPVFSEIIAVNPGTNFTSIELGQSRAMISEHIYLLELINAKNEKLYLKFRYRK